jgi:predicted GH43/DUF377 family glycosyl hydrolase
MNLRHLQANGAFSDLFRRHDANPILTAMEWPYPVHTVFNPGAIRLQDGSTLLLCRCEDRRGFSHLAVARSDNGVDAWKIDQKPTFVPNPEKYPEELWGVEDPRITYLPEEDFYVIAYTAFSKDGPGVSLAKTKDFKKFERLCFAMQPDDKDAALFPCKFGGQYALIHRPMSDLSANMWISYSPDLKSWGGHKLLLPARRGAWWDAHKIGLNTPPIETKEGWLVIYHGVRRHASGSLYRLGLALFDQTRRSASSGDSPGSWRRTPCTSAKATSRTWSSPVGIRSPTMATPCASTTEPPIAASASPWAASKRCCSGCKTTAPIWWESPAFRKRKTSSPQALLEELVPPLHDLAQPV